MAKNEKVSAKESVKHIRRETPRKYHAEEKLRMVLEGVRGEASIADLCRREGISPNRRQIQMAGNDRCIPSRSEDSQKR